VQQLNFPDYKFNLINKNDKPYIFDVVRKKYMVLLPEEWVRQHLLHYFIEEKNFPKGLIKVEQYIKVNNMKRFTDVSVYITTGKPALIAECKSYKIKITRYTFEQIAAYGATLQPKYFVLTNGLTHFVYQLNWQNKTSIFLNDVPLFNEINNSTA